MKKFSLIIALAAIMLLSLGGLALAENPPLPLAFPHVNSNDTGFFFVEQVGTFASLVRAVPGQLVHSDFQLNTNSCASCHMTHTAVGGSLLFQRTVSDTCFACHDGTIGALNVLASPRSGTAGVERFGGSETAGTFGLVDGVNNASVHNVDLGTTLSAAPGGNRGGSLDSAGVHSAGWAGTFTCASCHAPHGSYSIRLLHSNPALVGWRDANPNEATNFATGGLWNRGNTLAVAATVYADHAVHGVVYQVDVTAAIYNNIAAPWLYGAARATTLTASRTVGTHTFPAGRYNQHNTRIYATNLYNPNTAHLPADQGGPFSTVVDAVYLLNDFFEINYMTGQIVITPANRTALLNMGADLATLRIDLARALVVTAATTGSPLSLNHINTESYSQLNYNRFCAACHTDYLPQGGTADSRATAMAGGYGTYSLAHRHTINRRATVGGSMTVTGEGNQLLCVSCHFAHGADSRMMRLADASLNNFAAPLDDVNPSSALKRYVNQAVCWSCHANSAATVFKNTDYYWDNYEANNGYQW